MLTRIAEEHAALPTTELDFCIDPVRRTQRARGNPIIVVTAFTKAEAICKESEERAEAPLARRKKI